MSPLLRAELIKLRTTRTFAALAGVAVATSVILAALTSLIGEPTQESVLVDVFASDTSSLFILILAVIGISGEWRHRTITGSLLAAPNRLRFLTAKTLAYAAAGVVMSLAISITVAVVGYVALTARDLPVPEVGELLGLFGRNALIAALLGAFGVCIGGLVRNQPTAIAGVLVFSFALEPALISIFPEIGPYGPFVGLPLGVQDIPADAFGFADLSLLSPGAAALGMLAWIGAFFTAAALLLRYRDVE